LNWFNRRYVQGQDIAQAARWLVPYWQRAYGTSDRAADTELTPTEWQQTLTQAIVGELDFLGQAGERARFAFQDRVELSAEAQEMLAQPYAQQVLCAFAQGIAALQPFTYQAIDAFVSELRMRFKAALGIRSRDVMYTLRAALTGRTDGPCLILACQVLGRTRCILRTSPGCDIIGAS